MVDRQEAKPRILIVAPEGTERLLLVRDLTRAGYLTTELTCEDLASGSVQIPKYELALLDLRSCPPSAEVLARLPAGNRKPLIAVAYDSDLESRALAEGHPLCLVSATELHRLRWKVGAVLNKRIRPLSH